MNGIPRCLSIQVSEDKWIFVRYRDACSPIPEHDCVFSPGTYHPEKSYIRDLPTYQSR